MTGPASAADWPLSGQWCLDVTPAAARQARAHLRAALAGWEMSHDSEAAELVISELVTNALAASAGHATAMTACLFAGPKRLRIEVWDVAPGVPEARQPDDEGESGRGLELVGALAVDWGWAVLRDGLKVVWAEMENDGNAVMENGG